MAMTIAVAVALMTVALVAIALVSARAARCRRRHKQHLRWIAHGGRARRNVLQHHRVRSQLGAPPDDDGTENGRAATDVRSVFDDRQSVVAPGLGDPDRGVLANVHVVTDG